MRAEVYTAVFGETDELRDPSILTPGVRYVCATDAEIVSSVWKPLYFDVEPDPVRMARRFKLTLHQRVSTGVYIWMDAPFRLDVDLGIFADMLLSHDLLVFKHPWRATIEEEGRKLADLKLAPGPVLRDQVKRYRRERFPLDRPLSSTGFMVRRNDKRTQLMNDIWWAELELYGHTRDQMSFDYAAWKVGVNIGYLQGT